MSNNLNGERMAPNSASPEVAGNNGLDALDAAITERLELDASAGNPAGPSATALARSALVAVLGAAAPRTVTLPPVRRLVAMLNAGTAPVTFKVGTGAVEIAAGLSAVVYLDGSVNGIKRLDFGGSSSGGGGGGGGGGGNSGRVKASGYVKIDDAANSVIGFKGLNVASVTRNSEGRYRVTFTTPLSTVEYGCNVAGRFGTFGTDTWTVIAGIDRAGGFGFTTDHIDFNFRSSDSGGTYDPVFFSFEIYDPEIGD